MELREILPKRRHFLEELLLKALLTLENNTFSLCVNYGVTIYAVVSSVTNYLSNAAEEKDFQVCS